jgi:hypothetical protein
MIEEFLVSLNAKIILQSHYATIPESPGITISNISLMFPYT